MIEIEQQYFFSQAICGHEVFTSLPSEQERQKQQLCPTCFRQALADQGEKIIDNMPELWRGLVSEFDQLRAEWLRINTLQRINRWIGLHERVGVDTEAWKIALAEMTREKKHPYFWLYFRGLDALSQIIHELRNCA